MKTKIERTAEQRQAKKDELRAKLTAHKAVQAALAAAPPNPKKVAKEAWLAEQYAQSKAAIQAHADGKSERRAMIAQGAAMKAATVTTLAALVSPA